MTTTITNAHLESQLEAFFRKRVRLVGGLTEKLAPTTAGMPDRLVVMPGGRIYLVELKQLHQRPSPIQKVWHQRMRELYNVEVVTLAGREAVVRWLAELVEAAGPKSRKPRTTSPRVG